MASRSHAGVRPPVLCSRQRVHLARVLNDMLAYVYLDLIGARTSKSLDISVLNGEHG